jgi:hypothetical protein
MDSRDLKFRIWLYKEQKFVYNILIGNDNQKYLQTSNGWKSLTDKDGVVQQYTGYQDINGMGIYEGDILKYKGRIVDTQHCYMTNHNEIISDVVWRYGQYYMNDNNFSNTLQHIKTKEIVGHIFEIEK